MRLRSSAPVRAALLVVWLALFGVVGLADAQVVLHEFLPPDANEDVNLAATTLDGDLPAAIQTPSGLATAPDPRRPPASDEVYAGATTDDSPDAAYEPDRDTRRPNIESYDDPFSPATVPFKRLRAYDAVAEDYTLYVRNKALRPVARGNAVGPGDEPFYGDLSVELLPDQPVRIPTVGPGTRLLRMHANPEAPFDVLQDDADNWFVRGKVRQRIRLVVELAIARASFGSEFADVGWGDLERRVAPQPASQKAAFLEVAAAIGVSRASRPRDVVAKMVEYFRGFAASDEPPRTRGDIYLDLALSKKGVCRHRAFAFLVTALHLGIPTRMVVNEAHAWVEVHDGTLWHRIDLGGASLDLDHEADPVRPPHVPPPDPYAWPTGRDSGQELAERTRAPDGPTDPNAPPDPNRPPRPDASGAPAGSASPGPDDPNDPNGASGPSNRDPSGGGFDFPLPSPTSFLAPTSGEPGRPPSEVAVRAVDRDVRRGLPLHVKGEVASAGSPCARVRVDVVLVGPTAPDGLPIGSLSTSDRGVFDGAVVVPRDLPVGDYDLVVVTGGDARCAPGRSP